MLGGAAHSLGMCCVEIICFVFSLKGTTFSFSLITCVQLIILFAPLFPVLYKPSVSVYSLSRFKVILMVYVLMLLKPLYVYSFISPPTTSTTAWQLLAAGLIYLCLMQNTFVWLYSMLFRHHRNVVAISLPTLPLCSTHRGWVRVRNRDWWQLVVFSPEMRCSLPLHRLT